MTVIINTSEKTIEIQGVYSVDEVMKKLNELIEAKVIDAGYTFKQPYISYPVYPVYPSYPYYPVYPTYPIITFISSHATQR